MDLDQHISTFLPNLLRHAVILAGTWLLHLSLITKEVTATKTRDFFAGSWLLHLRSTKEVTYKTKNGLALTGVCSNH